MRVILSSSAARELVEVAKDYEDNSPELGSVFIDEFESIVQLVRQFPGSGSPFGKRFRRILLKRFPYSVLYAESKDVLRVVAIMHQHRGPKFIASRLAKEQ
ncbi:MAG: type II toxin-antitoxin system RelE/ParE family toxin [bacterium]|nr:type II toxin-antitoxin system RelE/ParE family toxin [bacterium]